VAIFRLSVSLIQRSKGHNVTAASAYRSGESLVDENGKKHNYLAKTQVYKTGLLNNEPLPDFLNTRDNLWNEIANKERQHNARLAREVVVSFPIELQHNPLLMEEMLESFIKENFVSQGMLADYAMHKIDYECLNQN
jgi:hypothetical protein